MTEVFATAAHSLDAKSSLYQMPDSPEQVWHQNCFSQQQLPMHTSDWGGTQGHQMGGMQDVDLRMFQHDYIESYGVEPGQLTSPNIRYDAEGGWASDVDMDTPSTAGPPLQTAREYHTSYGINRDRLSLPQIGAIDSSAASHSPRSSVSCLSPASPSIRPAPTLRAHERPPISRAITAPEQGRLPAAGYGAGGPPPLARPSTSEDGDEDSLPHEDGKARGRKRQRIPHTAVERRYRENLNAQLDRLRQTVPALTRRRPLGPGKAGSTGGGGGDAGPDALKPSKCEVLNGAIEHIVALDKENAALKHEVQVLRARLGIPDTEQGTAGRGWTFGT